MRKITKIKRSVRAISPVIATLLMIAIAVVASLIVYAWVTGYIGGTTTKASNSMLIQSASHTSDNFLIVYVQNVGQGTIQLKQTQSIYVNSVLMNIKDTSTPAPTGGMVTVSPGTTASLTTDNPYTGKEKLQIKITATDGTFAEYTTSGFSTVSTGTFQTYPSASFSISNSYPNVGELVTFTDKSVKGSGTINQWSWNFGDGAFSSDQNPSHSYSTTGPETVILTVTDTNSRTATTTSTLVVSGFVSPTSSFSWTITNLVVSFTDTSTAGSGTITGRSWIFGDGATNNLNVPNPTHTYTSTGQKTVTLTVTNSNNKQSTTTRTINVGIDAPTAEFTVSDPNPNVGQTVIFTDASISGTTGTVNQWLWNFGDGATSTLQNPTHAYTTPYSKTITLTVTASNGGGSSTATHTVIVNDYTPPISSFTFVPAAPTVNQLVTFTDASSAGSGTITAWSWTFGDGGTSTDQNPTHAYSLAGQETVSLIVTNSNGKQTTTTQTIAVTSSTPSNQISFIITTPSSTTAGSALSITVTARDESGNVVTGYAGTVHFTSSDGQATLPADSTLTSGTKTFMVTLKTTGSQTITASDGTVTATSGLITVNPVAASKLVYIAGDSQSITQRTGTGSSTRHVSSVITVQMQDLYNNPVLATIATSITLTSDSSGGRFYTDSQGTSQTTTISMAAGSSSANFYYSDSSIGTPTIMATSGSLQVSTHFTVNSYQLAFTAGTLQSFAVNSISPIGIRVQSQSSDNSAHNPGSTLTIALSSSSPAGTFYSDSQGNNQITSVTISTTSPYTATFYYKDAAQGTPTLTASATGYTSATTSFVIQGSATQLKFTGGAGQSIFVSQVSSIITVSQQDSNGIGINAAAPLIVALTPTSATGAFYNNGQGTGNPIMQVTIAQGSSSTSFFYKDTTTGSSTITASSTGLTSATTTLTIMPNQVSDGGFDQSGNNSPWHTSGSGYTTNHETSDTAPNTWGPYAELETVQPGYSGTGSATLTSTFSPALAISSIPSTANSLSMMVYNNGYNGPGLSGGTGYYSFQIVLTASDGSQLIYWWGSNPATAPTPTGTVKVINLGAIQGQFTAGQWVQFNRPLQADWTNAGLSSSATLTSIALQCNGYHTGNSQYGQELFIDNVAIQ